MYKRQAYELSCKKNRAYSILPQNVGNIVKIVTYGSPLTNRSLWIDLVGRGNTIDMTGLTFDNTYVNFYLYTDKADKYSYSLVFSDKNSAGGLKSSLRFTERVADKEGWQLVSYKLSTFRSAGVSINLTDGIDFNMSDSPFWVYIWYGFTIPFSRDENNFDAPFKLVVDNFILTKDMPLDEILDNLYL